MATVEENLTRVYTINLGRAWLTPEHKRTDRVINMIREFATKHMKSDEVKLEQDLNRQIWSRGKTNPPRKVRVKMVKDEDGVVTVSLYEDVPAATEAPAAAEEEEKKPEAASVETATAVAAEEPKAEESKSQTS
ncbi:50S ribosomal protein L31e [Candidatus Nitrososphaera gargensis Ga9.2]|uniref:Large ribosomal subunit protein eL31 n=2 Tax=Candidatus Nitrososphaera gargensis TaxID=497727 RepID=K0IJ55_NITGG